jgi:hypothetical protein
LNRFIASLDPPPLRVVGLPTDSSVSVLPESGGVNTTFTFRGGRRLEATLTRPNATTRTFDLAAQDVTDPKAGSRVRAVLVLDQ